MTMDQRIGMDGEPRSHAPWGRRLRHELIEYGLISVYLYVCFGSLILYKVAILQAHGISYTPYGLAAVKALILAKFMLLGHAARVGDRHRRRPVDVIIRKSVLFLLLLIVLSAVEEAVSGMLHGQSIGASLAGLGGGTLWQFLATCLIMLLILVPYIAFREVSTALGEGAMLRLLLHDREGEPPSRP
jgi:hypothetical protein